MQRLRNVGFPKLAFWICFGVLVIVSAAYDAIFAAYVAHEGALDGPLGAPLAWATALACWLTALPAIWIISHLESRWISRRVQEAVAGLTRQCENLRDTRAFVPLTAGGAPDLERLVAALNAVLDRFNQVLVRQHQFASDVAHEMRTPLTAQCLVGENALARKCTNAELREVVGSMLEESKHMKRLIESLLELTRASATSAAEAEQGRAPLPLELGELARGCVESLHVLAEENGQRIELIERPVWVNADPTMVRQALLNVIHNAIEHCQTGACIRVETARFGPGQAMVRVTDDGPGIAPEEQKHVFERFYRRPTEGRHRGLGLGLAIAKAVLKSQGGSIHLRSEVGEGACFTLLLPLLEEGAPGLTAEDTMLNGLPKSSLRTSQAHPHSEPSRHARC